MNSDRIALIAGDGILPEILAERLLKKNLLKLIIVLQGSAGRFGFFKNYTYESPPGKINKILNLLKKNKINKTLIIGKIDKKAFLERKGFDIKALQMLKKIRNGNDTSIFNIITSEFLKINIQVLEQDIYLSDMLACKGILTRKKPDRAEITDAEFGMDYARKLASMDIGQSIVVKNKTIIAVEAAEGTDKTIERGGKLGKKNCVVCKASRQKQDKRFDIPAIGIDTLRVMKENNCTAIALEAGCIFMVDPDEIINYADTNRISIIGI